MGNRWLFHPDYKCFSGPLLKKKRFFEPILFILKLITLRFSNSVLRESWLFFSSDFLQNVQPLAHTIHGTGKYLATWNAWFLW